MTPAAAGGGEERPRSAWSQALALAQRTPASRNRCVDFLRAVSIIVVVIGHWLMAAPWVDDSGAHISHLLAVEPRAQWLTWGFQVMPVFFFVGGYANGISWDAALRDGRPYRYWIAARLGRLLTPVLVLLAFWILAAAAAQAAGVPPAYVSVASQVALVPTWFLAVYAVVTLLVPLTRASWRRTGMASFWILVLLAAVMDFVYFGLAVTPPGWLNYVLVWAAVHQLGYAWLDGRFRSRARCVLWCLAGLLTLVLLTELGPWPRSLVGVPGEAASNTTPPHLPLLALTAFQFGGLLLAEPRLSAWLVRTRLWAGTIFVNGIIMTVFLWHSSVMILLFGAALLFDGVGLGPLPGAISWWAARVPWMLVFALGLVPAVVAFRSFERPSSADGAVPVAWRTIAGSLLMVAGLALLARDGLAGQGPLKLRAIPAALPFLGALVAGLGPVEGWLRVAGRRLKLR